MSQEKFHNIGDKGFINRLIFYFFILVVMSNLNAMVDVIHHPEISYFDEEHLVVGGVTSIFVILLFGTLETYLQHLEEAKSKIKTLEKYISMCANCKRIKIPVAEVGKKIIWQSIESYIIDTTTTQISHGICPECASKLYPEYANDSGLESRSP